MTFTEYQAQFRPDGACSPPERGGASFPGKASEDPAGRGHARRPACSGCWRGAQQACGGRPSEGARQPAAGGRQCLREDYTGRLPSCPDPRLHRPAPAPGRSGSSDAACGGSRLGPRAHCRTRSPSVSPRAALLTCPPPELPLPSLRERHPRTT